jgi:hypothetical protein
MAVRFEQVAWMYRLLMASASNKVQCAVWNDGNTLGNVTVWMLEPDRFLLEHEDYASENCTWRELHRVQLEGTLRDIGLDLDDRRWRKIA